jgi:hypothetical protein
MSGYVFKSKRVKWILGCIWTVSSLNLMAFIIGDMYLGGSAMNGYAKSGQYFLCAHAKCVEVSRALWLYSHWHGISVGALFLVAATLFAIFHEAGQVSLKPRGLGSFE